MNPVQYHTKHQIQQIVHSTANKQSHFRCSHTTKSKTKHHTNSLENGVHALQIQLHAHGQEGLCHLVGRQQTVPRGVELAEH